MDKKIQLEYTPTNSDLSTFVPKGQAQDRPSSFLALKGTGYLVHGNSYTVVKEFGEDNSSNYKTWRRWRIWRLASGGGLAGVGQPESNWADDNLSKTSNWTDIPGFVFAESPNHWRDERRLLEFAVSVEGYTQIGGLYFFVVVSTKPGKYRVEMSSAKSIPFEKWRELQKTKQPWAKESGCVIQVDSTWLEARTAGSPR